MSVRLSVTLTLDILGSVRKLGQWSFLNTKYFDFRVFAFNVVISSLGFTNSKVHTKVRIIYFRCIPFLSNVWIGDKRKEWAWLRAAHGYFSKWFNAYFSACEIKLVICLEIKALGGNLTNINLAKGTRQKSSFFRGPVNKRGGGGGGPGH